MEEKQTTSVEPTDTNPQVDLINQEPIVKAIEATPATNATATAANRSLRLTIAAVVIVVVALAAVLYSLEKSGRVNTGVFSSIIDAQAVKADVAIVNGEVITQSELSVASAQLAQAAVAQGADPADPTIQASIKSQALDLMIGTALLTQTAKMEGIEVTDTEVAERLAAIEADAGGAEILATRMEEFGITKETLEADVRSELTISKLLDTVVTDEDIVVTEDEIITAYDGAGGADAGLPPLEEVRDQIEAQLQQVKGQTIIEEYVGQLRADADIEIIK